MMYGIRSWSGPCLRRLQGCHSRRGVTVGEENRERQVGLIWVRDTRGEQRDIRACSIQCFPTAVMLSLQRDRGTRRWRIMSRGRRKATICPAVGRDRGGRSSCQDNTMRDARTRTTDGTYSWFQDCLGHSELGRVERIREGHYSIWCTPAKAEGAHGTNDDGKHSNISRVIDFACAHLQSHLAIGEETPY